MLSQEDKAWAKKQSEISKAAHKMTTKAHDKALDYTADYVENMNDKAWRVMVGERYAYETGIALAFIDYVLPTYNKMIKELPKRGGLSKIASERVAHVFLAHTIRSIAEGIQRERLEQESK